MRKSLLEKYNVPVPRYTSYPTVPFWDDQIDVNRWKSVFRERYHARNNVQGVSLYIHLPFCESLCTYCGCTKKITSNHDVEPAYIATLLKEWKIYTSLMDEPPVIRELHLGGGTPTFFSPKNLEYLLHGIFKNAIIPHEHEFSIEGHPNNTTFAHLQTLAALGFRRISYGVQDNDPEVQRIINRIQPVENVQRATDEARHAGFESVNFDLIYGLPRQTMGSMKKTIEQCIAIKPDRIAFYSYAHVPWVSRGQRLFDETDLPGLEEKMGLYQLGKKIFAENGYSNIGMDHFALPGDGLYEAREKGTLHRNFMGYSTQDSSMIIGLGMSAISDTGNAYAQNEKKLQDYTAGINRGDLSITRGYFLSDEDSRFKKYILDISCKGYTRFLRDDFDTLNSVCFPQLEEMAEDGLLNFDDTGVELKAHGLNFIRNVCSAFDIKLSKKVKADSPVFSKAI